MQFRTFRASPVGWALILVAGGVLGLALTPIAGWPWFWGVFIGIAGLVGFLRILDRRHFGRSVTIIKIERTLPELDRLTLRLRARGLNVAVSRDPLGIACAGRIHAKVVAAIEDDAADGHGRAR